MKIKSLTILSVALAALFACTKPAPVEEPLAPEANYQGTVNVNLTNGDLFTLDEVKVNITVSEDGQTADIIMYQVKLAPRMPQLDITIPGVQLSQNGRVLTCEETIPLALGGEFTNYKVTGLTGTRSEEELSFSLKFGSTPTSFTGVSVEEEEEELEGEEK